MTLIPKSLPSATAQEDIILHSAVAARDHRIAELVAEVEALREAQAKDTARLEEQLSDLVLLTQVCETQRLELASIKNSLWWRVISPLREAVIRLRKR